MNKKKLMALCLIVCLLAIAVVGGSLAYFTDIDAATNTMVIGNVDIEQNEWERDGNNNLVDFEDGKKLFPAVYDNLSKDGSVEYTKKGDEKHTVAVWDASINNEIDKIITVTNTGSEDAYVRTILAFETQRHYKEGSSTEFTDLYDTYFGFNGTYESLNRYITIDGVEYSLAVCLYENALTSGETSEPSLKQFFLSPAANNETSKWFGNQYVIYAVSQAVQTEGFTSAKQALDRSFGDLTDTAKVTDEMLVNWLTGK